jgi:TatD DNase family protein
MLIDSHCHLNYLSDPRGALAAARERGVSTFLCIGVDEAHIGEVLQLAADEPDVHASVGEHPEAASGDPRWVEQYLDDPNVVAVGETGLDYFHVEDESQRGAQRDNFAAHLAIARTHELPVVVHTRMAETDTLDLIGAEEGVVGVLHCFTESWAMAKAALDLGFYISISGIVTFKNGENVRDVARRVPEDRLLIETDSPWLAPVPHRGKSNEPAFVRDTAEYLAELRGVGIGRLAEQTSANFERLFLGSGVLGR